MSIAAFLKKIKPQYIKKILITMPMRSIISRLVDPKANINSGSKVEKALNRWVSIPEVSNNL
jgi:hypothetical protein